MKKLIILVAIVLATAASLPAQRAGRLSNEWRSHTLTVNVGNAKTYQIYLNDNLVQGSQARVREGSYRVRVEAQGYETWQRTINVNADQRLQVNLNAQVYTLSFAINNNSTNYRVMVNGKQVNARSVSLPGGNHSIQVIANGFENYQNNITLNSNQVLRISLVESRGILQVNIPPNAKLSIDGKNYEQNNIRLASGNYTVRVDFGRLHTQTRVNIRAGATTNIRLGLELAVN